MRPRSGDHHALLPLRRERGLLRRGYAFNELDQVLNGARRYSCVGRIGATDRATGGRDWPVPLGSRLRRLREAGHLTAEPALVAPFPRGHPAACALVGSRPDAIASSAPTPSTK